MSIIYFSCEEWVVEYGLIPWQISVQEQVPTKEVMECRFWRHSFYIGVEVAVWLFDYSRSDRISSLIRVTCYYTRVMVDGSIWDC